MNFCKRLIVTLLFSALTTLCLSSFAHQGSEGYVYLNRAGDGVKLRVDSALRDLDVPLTLDADADGLLTAGEIERAWPAIDAYVKSHVQVMGCAHVSDGQSVVKHSNVAYASLSYQLRCDHPSGLVKAPELRYSLFKDVDANHRATARIDWAGVITVRVLNPQETGSTELPEDASSDGWRFVSEGVHHIITGYDHLLFLTCLLFTAVMRRANNSWVPVERLHHALWPVLGIVTAFTLAHSITLTLAALQWVSFSSQLIEPLIAITIVVAALDNLWNIMGRHRLVMTFLFGLIHGFGFAGVLQEMQLPTLEFVRALVQFNLGLELGQVIIVTALTGLLFIFRGRAAYVPWVIRGGSTAAIAVSVLWLTERTADVSLLPF